MAIICLVLLIVLTIAIVYWCRVPAPEGLYKKRHRPGLVYGNEPFVQPTECCKDCGIIITDDSKYQECVPIEATCKVRSFGGTGKHRQLLCVSHARYSCNSKCCGYKLVNWNDIINAKPLKFPPIL